MDAVIAFFTSLTFDWLIVAALMLVLSLDAIRSGSNRVTALAVSLPLAAALFSALSGTLIIGAFVTAASPLIQAAIALGLLVILFILTYRILDSYGEPSFFLGILAGIACAIVAVTVLVGFDAVHALWKFGPSVTAVFGDAYALLWILGAFAVLAFARR